MKQEHIVTVGELISKLTAFQNEHGDLPVVIRDPEDCDPNYGRAIDRDDFDVSVAKYNTGSYPGAWDSEFINIAFITTDLW